MALEIQRIVERMGLFAFQAGGQRELVATAFGGQRHRMAHHGLADALADLPLSFDLADLRGYHYHSGVAFAAYCAGSPGAVALGGRYDDFGRAYGRARPATGFSMDLRELARLSPNGEPRGAILAPWPEDDALHAEALRLRAQGEHVVLALPGHEGTWREAGCDRILVRSGNDWIIETLKED